MGDPVTVRLLAVDDIERNLVALEALLADPSLDGRTGEIGSGSAPTPAAGGVRTHPARRADARYGRVGHRDRDPESGPDATGSDHLLDGPRFGKRAAGPGLRARSCRFPDQATRSGSTAREGQGDRRPMAQGRGDQARRNRGERFDGFPWSGKSGRRRRCVCGLRSRNRPPQRSIRRGWRPKTPITSKTSFWRLSLTSCAPRSPQSSGGRRP